ncbi:fatty acid amide hydrolase-like [Hibiscus syriacus]|uniref:fatty acid amide hydrolase-like n=1 Tax=Hibiscus syriacus TaxID=106335 RepID=UPI00192388EF|nr:fatty acid amide hydrolase-like [Hibiscus syriacus]
MDPGNSHVEWRLLYWILGLELILQLSCVRVGSQFGDLGALHQLLVDQPNILSEEESNYVGSQSCEIKVVRTNISCVSSTKVETFEFSFQNSMITYPISKASLKTGELDYINGANIIRYHIVENFLGLPAITVPVGYDKAGLLIGLQFIGKPWSEPTLMHIALAMQALCITDYRKLKVFYDILD